MDSIKWTYYLKEPWYLASHLSFLIVVSNDCIGDAGMVLMIPYLSNSAAFFVKSSWTGISCLNLHEVDTKGSY